MKLATIALASAFALSGTFALANTVRHKPIVRTYDTAFDRTYDSYTDIPLASSAFMHP